MRFAELTNLRYTPHNPATHLLRHNYADAMKMADMRDEDITAIAGWKSSSMLSRYGASAAAERAQGSPLRLSLVNNLA